MLSVLCLRTNKITKRVSSSILVPIALFSSLSRRSLGTRIEGLWEHRIFELIWIFWLAVWKQRNLERKSKIVRGDCCREVRNSCDQRRLQCNSGGFGWKFSQFFIFTVQHFSWLSTCRCCNKTAFCWLIFSTKKQQTTWIFEFLQRNGGNQELSIVGSCVKRVWGSQQVGESFSSSQLSTLQWGKKEWTADVKWTYVSFR